LLSLCARSQGALILGRGAGSGGIGCIARASSQAARRLSSWTAALT